MLLLLSLIWGALQLNSVQTYLGKKVASYFGDELQTKIDIDRLEVDFFNSVDLHHFYVEDRKGDTLAYFESLDLTVLFVNTKNRYLQASLDLDQPYFNLYQEKGKEESNLGFIMNYFSSEDSTSSESWSIVVNSLNVKRGKFMYHDYNTPDTLDGVNYSHVDITKLFLHATDLNMEGGNIQAQIDTLSLNEANGFELKRLQTDLTVEPEILSFQNLIVQTFATELDADLQFTADSFDAYDDFVNNVHISTSFRNSLVNLEDLSYFVSAFKGIKEQVYLDGKIKGPISNISGEELEIQFNKETMLRGDFDMRGLPDFENTYLHFNIGELRTSASDLRSMPYPPFEEDNHLEVPENLDQLGQISFSGNFSGYVDDFVAYGDLSSNLGGLTTDLAVKEDADENFHYKGSLKSSGFDMGKLLEVDKMGTVSLDVKIDGKGVTKETIDAKAEGKIKSIKFADYDYRDIDLNGRFSDQEFTGEVSIKDENLSFNFNGTIDARKSEVISDFELDVQKAFLGNLNLFNESDSVTQIAFKADFNIVGTDIDKVEGKVEVDSIYYQDSEQSFKVDSLDLSAQNIEGNRKLELQSSMLQATLSGQYKLNELGDVLHNMILDYIPNSTAERRKVDDQSFEFKAKIKNADPITKVLIPELRLDSQTNITASFNSRINKSQFKVSGQRFKYGKNIVKAYELQLSSNRDSIGVLLNATELNLSGVNSFDTLQFKTLFQEGELNSEIYWKSLNKKTDPGQLKVDGTVDDLDKMNFNFYDSYISIQDSEWRIDSSNQISIKGDTIDIHNFKFENNNQALAVEGKISKTAYDSLTVNLNQLDLAYVSTLLPADVAKMKGVANGEVKVKDVYKDLALQADLTIKSFYLNGVDIGNAALTSEWQSGNNYLKVDGNLGEKEDQLLKFFGKVYPKNSSESLDLTVEFNHFPLLILSPYIKDYLTNLEGDVDGKIKVSGEASKPILNGELNMVDAGMTVNYLNTHYTINDKFIIESDFIGFNNIRIKDRNGNSAVATGTIFHENYENLNLDIGLEYDDFIALNTTSKDNDVFFGKAVCSGNANISGFADQLIININATAQKGTNFSIPLDEGVEVSSSDFLIFTNSPKEKEEEKEIDLSGIQLNFDLDIRPEAKLKIIFDEQIGDVLEAQGSGNLKLEINTLGNFNIFGQYVIEDGEYLFTLKNIVNKRFQLAEGSRISWDGNPYKARLDMRAIYNTRASLIDIMPEDSTGNYRRRVPVDLELHMTGFLLSPEITFDIELPTADDETRRRLESILYVNRNDVNQQEMNQQVFGLLVFNRFMPPSTGTAGQNSFDRGAPGVNNGYEFLSNQMSNWLSQLSDQFDVGVNYRQGNEYTSDEVDVSLSTELFEDRLVLDGNVGYSSQNNQVANQNRSNFIGEFTAEYKLSKDGRFRVKGFNRSTNNSLLQLNSPYTQGVGLFYREEFDTFEELWRRYFGKDSKSDKSKDS